MTTQFILHNFDSLNNEWSMLLQKKPSGLIFSTPQWCGTWWDCFGAEYELFLGAIYENNELIGISPLKLKQDTASFIGSTNVCDYLDFIIKPGSEGAFFTALLAEIKARGIKTLDLYQLRLDSTVMRSLTAIAADQGFNVTSERNDVSVYLNLPETWDDYLNLLSRKQRHELKRKIRRLEETGSVTYRTADNAGEADINIFLYLFKNSRRDKADFLTPDMELFFRKLLSAMAGIGLLKLNFMELDNKIIAATICFDFNNTVYLYNSGFDREYNWASAGLISKALSIKDSIEKKRKIYDFLRGDEEYKYHLGGVDLPLHHCTITIK
jgi:CelD/BcsL family acetyltransferase involved in cellulose biosynthesis